MKLIPNCSEAVFRLDVTNLSEKERIIVSTIFEEDAKSDDEEDDFDVSLYESKVFGKETLKYDGEYPYHCEDRIVGSMEKAEKKLGKKLRYEFEGE